MADCQKELSLDNILVLIESMWVVRKKSIDRSGEEWEELDELDSGLEPLTDFRAQYSHL